jgi:hypothetical protein
LHVGAELLVCAVTLHNLCIMGAACLTARVGVIEVGGLQRLQHVSLVIFAYYFPHCVLLSLQCTSKGLQAHAGCFQTYASSTYRVLLAHDAF